MKKTIRMNESELHRLISESVKRVLRESKDIDDDSYYGGGLPDKKTTHTRTTYQKEIEKILEKMKPFIDRLAEIFNEAECTSSEVYEKAMNILNNIDSLAELGSNFYELSFNDENELGY